MLKHTAYMYMFMATPFTWKHLKTPENTWKHLKTPENTWKL